MKKVTNQLKDLFIIPIIIIFISLGIILYCHNVFLRRTNSILSVAITTDKIIIDKNRESEIANNFYIDDKYSKEEAKNINLELKTYPNIYYIGRSSFINLKFERGYPKFRKEKVIRFKESKKSQDIVLDFSNLLKNKSIETIEDLEEITHDFFENKDVSQKFSYEIEEEENEYIIILKSIDNPIIE